VPGTARAAPAGGGAIGYSARVREVAVGDTLVGTDYVTPDIVAKVTGRAKYAEDFRAEGMLWCKLLLSPRPHARVRRLDVSRALALPGVRLGLKLNF
jgi:xanthine dehydrogenase molybdopterin-binding subunit B